MTWNKKRLRNFKLYLILDAQVLDYRALLRVLKESVRCGIDIVQLRDKFGSSKDMTAFCRQALNLTKHRIPFIVNDRVDVAFLTGADGVHVGQEDIACNDARRLLGNKAMIGVSCQTLAQARKAQKDGADYIGFGSVFTTPTKPERNPMNLRMLRQVLNAIDVPVFPIGGISRKNLNILTAIGVGRAAICRDILLAKNTGHVVKEFKQCLNAGVIQW
ncbi:MAG: thiamine phosphate synthase [Candidatus Omnitrophica bacterium]|nr:thiamine phosphate synthase [Candidatus Omnitrophota bacterium]